MAHSTKSYSNDLRDRVVQARLSGVSVEDVAESFQVSRDCVYRWVALYQETGSAHPKRRGGYKQPKIHDMKKFEAFAKAHAYSTLSQMRDHWEGEISEMSLSRAFKRLGWTRKKNTITTANATRKNAKHS
jgi:transposase